MPAGRRASRASRGSGERLWERTGARRCHQGRSSSVDEQPYSLVTAMTGGSAVLLERVSQVRILPGQSAHAPELRKDSVASNCWPGRPGRRAPGPGTNATVNQLLDRYLEIVDVGPPHGVGMSLEVWSQVLEVIEHGRVPRQHRSLDRVPVRPKAVVAVASPLIPFGGGNPDGSLRRCGRAGHAWGWIR